MLYRTPSASLLVVLIVLLAAACTKASDQNEQQVNQWYLHVNKMRYTQGDSMLFYAALMEAKTGSLTKEYQAMPLIAKGMHYSRKSKFDSALFYFKEAVQMLGSSTADSLVGKAYNGIGNVYKNTGNYPAAIAHLQQALQYFTRAGYTEGVAGVHSNLGQTYQLKEDLANSKTHLRMAMATLHNNRFSNAYLNALHTLANVYAQNGEIDSALWADNEGLSLVAATGSSLFLSPFFDNKAKCFAEKGLYDSASLYFTRSFAIDSASGNRKLMSDAYLNRGRLAIKQQQWGTAKDLLDKSIAVATAANYRLGRQEGLKELALLSTKQNDYTRAYQYQEAYVALKDSLLNERTESEIAALRTQFETTEKEQQIALQQAELRQQRLYIGGIVVLAVAVLLLIYSYTKRKQLQKQQAFDAAMHQQQEQATIRILTAEERERQRIASDLHDGIGQTMTAAWLNLQAIAARQYHNGEDALLIKKTTALVGDSCVELRQISHNMMPNVLNRKGLVNALRDFTSQTDHNTLSVSFQADDETLSLDSTTSIILYRVVQECINNVLKHSGATELDISVSKDAGELTITIEDNGVGINLQQLQSDGIGIQNIRSRIAYLKGSVEWNNTGNGTVVAIYIPLA